LFSLVLLGNKPIVRVFYEGVEEEVARIQGSSVYKSSSSVAIFYATAQRIIVQSSANPSVLCMLLHSPPLSYILSFLKRNGGLHLFEM
jgi:hypothetical protein